MGSLPEGLRKVFVREVDSEEESGPEHSKAYHPEAEAKVEVGEAARPAAFPPEGRRRGSGSAAAGVDFPHLPKKVLPT